MQEPDDLTLIDEKGDDVLRCCKAVRRRGIGCVIPRRGLAPGAGHKGYRRLSDRREKLAFDFTAFVQLFAGVTARGQRAG